MEYTTKIIQIEKEEDYKRFGFIKYPNCDYLNLIPIELWKEKQRKIYKILNWINTISLIFLFIAFPLGMIYKNYVLGGVGLILFFVGIILNSVYIDFREKKVFNKYWYFKPPYPIEKPHHYKEGDIIKININLELENKLK
jgi:hypothetical protein